MNKNKYQEALNKLRTIERGNNVKLRGVESVAPQVSCDTLQELVDRETPKKVIVDSEIDSADDGDCSIDFEYKVYTCPCCKYELDNESDHINIITNHFKYCFSCGQKLDWSENYES